MPLPRKKPLVLAVMFICGLFSGCLMGSAGVIFGRLTMEPQIAFPYSGLCGAAIGLAIVNLTLFSSHMNKKTPFVPGTFVIGFLSMNIGYCSFVALLLLIISL